MSKPINENLRDVRVENEAGDLPGMRCAGVRPVRNGRRDPRCSAVRGEEAQRRVEGREADRRSVPLERRVRRLVVRRKELKWTYRNLKLDC